MKKWIIIVILFNFLLSCNSKSQLERYILEWENKEIKFPNLKAKIYGKDTICSWLWEKRNKILIYINDEGCTSCKLKLPSWRNLIQEADSLKLDVSFVFVAHLKNYEELEFLQKDNKFYYPILYDYYNEIEQLNYFPKEFIFQTFLLDEHNRVKIVGNPVFIEKLWNMYKKCCKISN